MYLGVVYMSRASPVSRANSLKEVLLTASTDTQNDISKQNWLLIEMIFLGRGKIFVTQLRPG